YLLGNVYISAFHFLFSQFSFNRFINHLHYCIIRIQKTQITNRNFFSTDNCCNIIILISRRVHASTENEQTNKHHATNPLVHCTPPYLPYSTYYSLSFLRFLPLSTTGCTLYISGCSCM